MAFATRKKYLVVDFETTGLPQKFDDDGAALDAQGFQLGAAVIDADTFEIIDTFFANTRHDPQFPWSKQAQAVHGISQQMLSSEPELRVAAVDFMEWVASHFGAQNITLVAYNLPFDKAFLIQWAKAAGTKIAINHRYIDAMCVAAVADGVWKSDAAFATLGIQREAHNALDDVKLTIAYLKRVKDKCGVTTVAPVDR